MPRQSILKSTFLDDATEQAELAPTAGNVPELTVSDLSQALKRTVEDRFGHVRLRGEISNYRGPHASGHAYFSLKDEGARIDAVIWRPAFARLRIKPEEGMEVVATGKITTFPGKSSYQIVIENLEPAGVGALMALLDERRRRFAAEGLFDVARKLALPFIPGVIGIVTSPTGAVIRDILHRVAARFPHHLVVWPVRVQGETSGAEVAAAIRGLNALASGHAVTRPRLIIVARGGGSLEDLWSFNDEAVVRAVAEGTIPLISAVGHETDWTLIDHVADLRAPTPTGAAELALPVLAELLATVAQLRGRHQAALLRYTERVGTGFRALVRHLPSVADLLSGPRQRLDRGAGQLPSAGRSVLDGAQLRLAKVSGRLQAQSPQARMVRSRERLSALSDRLVQTRRYGRERSRDRVSVVHRRLDTAFGSRLRVLRAEQTAARRRLGQSAQRLGALAATTVARPRLRFGHVGQRLDSLSYRSVLARGFALVRDGSGAMVRSTEAMRATGLVSVEFSDGRIQAQTIGEGAGGEDAQKRRRVTRGSVAAAAPARQGSLFEG